MIYGLDIGGTKIEIAVFNEQLEQQSSWRVPTLTSDYQAFLKSLASLVEEADTRYGEKGIVGLGMPGLVDKDGTSLSANIPSANGKNVAADLGKLLGRPVASENDCRCFALSEAVGGAGDGYKTVYGAIIGTGAAGGFTISGKLLPSRQGIAGEYGHQQLPAFLQQKYKLPIRECGCGLPSCYEGYIAGPGLLFLHAHLGGMHTDVPAIATAWHEGEPSAVKTMNCYLDLLGSCFATLVMAYDPEVIVLGGGVSLIGGIVEELPGAIEPHIFKGFTAPPVVRAKFGDASGARGAAILARQMHDS